jgi:hypothetical protein
MEQSLSWETNGCSASQQILRLLWNLNVHYHVHKIPHWTLSWTRRIQFTPSYNYVRCILILFSPLRLDHPICIFRSGLPNSMYEFLISPCASYIHLIHLCLFTIIILCEEYLLIHSLTSSTDTRQYLLQLYNSKHFLQIFPLLFI